MVDEGSGSDSVARKILSSKSGSVLILRISPVKVPLGRARPEANSYKTHQETRDRSGTRTPSFTNNSGDM